MRVRRRDDQEADVSSGRVSQPCQRCWSERSSKVQSDERETSAPRLEDQHSRIQRVEGTGCGTLSITEAPQGNACGRSDLYSFDSGPEHRTPSGDTAC